MKIQAPEHLSPEGQKMFVLFSKTFEIEDADAILLEKACECHDRLRQSQALIDEHGIVIVSDSGMARGNPACKTEKDMHGQFLQYLKQMGVGLESMSDGPGRPAGK